MSEARQGMEKPLAFGPWGEPGLPLVLSAPGTCKRNCDLCGGATACDRSCGMTEERVQQLMRAAVDRGGRS